MKIAIICPFYIPAIGGVRKVVEELATRYVKKGHDVHVFCSDSDKINRVKIKEEIIDGVKVHRCYNWITLVNYATIYPSIYRKLRKEKFDIIHTHVSGHLHHLIAAIVAKQTKTPHIHTTHCPWTSGFRSLLGRILVPITYNTIIRIAFKLTDKNVGITPWELDIMKKYGAKDPISIRNGMSEMFYKKIKNNKVRKEYNIPKNKKIILFFGRMNPIKGPEHLAQAGIELLKERDDLYFLFAGPDEESVELVKSIIKGKKNISYVGRVKEGIENVVAVYQAADMYVLPSYREGLPLTLFEAMASGLPIVASPVNGIPYEMEENVNGLFIKYGDIKGIKKAIVKIIDNPKLAKEFSLNNIKTSRRYSWDNIANEYLKLYKQVIKDKKV